MQKIEFIDDSENETGGRNLKPVLTQGRKENEACKRFMTQASPRRSSILNKLNFFFTILKL
jgi:hypothetical protein